MSDFDRINVIAKGIYMYNFLKTLLLVFSLMNWNASFAEETQILDEIIPSSSSFESNYTDEPEITITKDGASTIEEYRINGQLYMLKVTPDGDFPPYYLYKENLGGIWHRVNGIDEPLIVPQWVVLEF
jgi:hypothetical protein